MKMNNKYLYLLERTDRVGYDEYDGCVVCAENEDEALLIAPWHSSYNEDIETSLIGIANDNIRLNSMVLGSFNAG